MKIFFEKTKQAFTIIELLVVAAIIVILATIVIINISQAQKKSRDVERKSDLTKIAVALETYKADKKSYLQNCIVRPITDPDCNFTDEGETPTSNPDLQDYIDLGYIPSWPIDPINYSPNVYRYKSDGVQYKIVATSETIDPADSIPDAQKKAGDFYDSADRVRFQISSSNTAAAW